MPVLGEGHDTPNGLQLWVDLPKEYKLTAPTYQELDRSGVPSAWPEGETGSIEVRVISGESHGIKSPVKPLGGCWYFHYKMGEKGKQAFQPIRTCRCLCNVAPSLISDFAAKGWTAFIYSASHRLSSLHGTC